MMADNGFPRVPGYHLNKPIGSGGMAIVYEAYDERNDRLVALKIIAPRLAEDPRYRERFVRESRAVTRLEHPNIVPVYDAREAGGVLFIAMRLIRGGDLLSVARNSGGLSADRVGKIISQIASALDAAHDVGLVHRDVKPANMLVDTGKGVSDHVYLSDFGLVKATMDANGLSFHGQFFGTIEYASPEQIDGRVVGSAGDQYALACSAFHLLYGELPLRHKMPKALSLQSWGMGLPDAIERVFIRAMTSSPQHRYPTCHAFAEALDQALSPATPCSKVSADQPEQPTNNLPPEAAAPALVWRAPSLAPPFRSDEDAARDREQPAAFRKLSRSSRAGVSRPKRPTHGLPPDVAPPDLLWGGHVADRVQQAELAPAESAPYYANHPRNANNPRRRRRVAASHNDRRRRESISAAQSFRVALVLVTVSGLSYFVWQLGSHSVAAPQAIQTVGLGSINASSPTPVPTSSPTPVPTSSPTPVHTSSPTLSPGQPLVSGVEQLANDEARAATTRDLGLVEEIYAPRAVVRDASCNQPGGTHVWSGQAEIVVRYQHLGGAFTGLKHKDYRVRFMPDSGQAQSASMTSETAGFFWQASVRYPLHGYDQWAFARVNGRWLITSFTYDMCHPA
jgi:serine/threonine protein kinase